MIDGCLVINLPHRTDRWELFQKQLPLLHSLGLKPERMDAIYGRTLPGFGAKPWFTKRLSEKRAQAWGGKAGCTLSHRNAIAEAKKRGWKNVLILEDDVSFAPPIAAQWRQLIGTMETLPQDWLAIYLYGHHPVSPIRAVHAYPETTCYELGGAFSTVAYILNGKYFNDVLEVMPKKETIWPWTARHKTIDRWFSRRLCLLGRVYAMAPFGITHLQTLSDATMAGEPYDAPNFGSIHSAHAKWFTVWRMTRCFRNRVALGFSIARQCIKIARGV
jgi:GR25 family glycosyltransferase involved in LPS biosynthesis